MLENMLKYPLIFIFIKAIIMEINPYLEHIKDLADRGDQLRRYL